MTGTLRNSALAANRQRTIRAVIDAPGEFIKVRNSTNAKGACSISQTIRLLSSIGRTVGRNGARSRPNCQVLTLTPCNGRITTLGGRNLSTRALTDFFRAGSGGLSRQAVVILSRTNIINTHRVRRLVHLIRGSNTHLIRLNSAGRARTVRTNGPFTRLRRGNVRATQVGRVRQRGSPRLGQTIRRTTSNGAPLSLRRVGRVRRLHGPSRQRRTVIGSCIHLASRRHGRILVITNAGGSHGRVGALTHQTLKLRKAKTGFSALGHMSVARTRHHCTPTCGTKVLVRPRGSCGGTNLVQNRACAIGRTLPKGVLVIANTSKGPVRFGPHRMAGLDICGRRHPRLTVNSLIQVAQGSPTLSLAGNSQVHMIDARGNLVRLTSVGRHGNGPRQMIGLPTGGPLRLRRTCSTAIRDTRNLAGSQMVVSVGAGDQAASLGLFCITVDQTQLRTHMCASTVTKLPTTVTGHCSGAATLDLRGRHSIVHLRGPRALGAVTSNTAGRHTLRQGRQIRPIAPDRNERHAG